MKQEEINNHFICTSISSIVLYNINVPWIYIIYVEMRHIIYFCKNMCGRIKFSLPL